ncbi:MAG: hypothetical protein ACLQGV_02510 [Bryobacteraceae bacterium]
MLEWLRKFGAKKLPSLQGAPLVPRQKSYSAQSGYVYLYHYAGRRAAELGSEPGTQFVFQVSADRTTFFPVSVFLADSALQAWQSAHHELRANERYAIAKMALLQAFDERQRPQHMTLEVLVRRADAESILETLGIE